MKLVTYSHNQLIRPGILIEDSITDIQSAWDGADPPGSVKEILERGPACIARLGELAESGEGSIPLRSVRLLAPIPRPGKVLARAGNYAEHIKEAGRKLGLSDSPRLTTSMEPEERPRAAKASATVLARRWPRSML